MLYLVNKPTARSRRGIISTIKSMKPPEAAVHDYKYDSPDKLLYGAMFLKQIGNRVRPEGEVVKIEY